MGATPSVHQQARCQPSKLSVSKSLPGIEDKRAHGSLVNEKLAQGCASLIRSPVLRRHFLRYIKAGSWVEKLQDENDTKRGKDKFSFNLSPPVKRANKVAKNNPLGSYSLPAGTAEMLQSMFEGAEVDPAEDTDAPAAPYVFEDEEMKLFLVASLLPLFLESKSYKDWEERSRTMHASSVSIHSSVSSTIRSIQFRSTKGGTKTDSEDRIERRDSDCTRIEELTGDDDTELEKDSPALQKIKDTFIKLSSMTDDEIMHLLANSGWMNQLTRIVEGLHICVSVADARISSPGFPLIYVNKCFETITGYRRKDVLGRNCKFLQCGNTEPEQVELISAALKNAKPLKIALTNKRKDGSTFFNLLALKPVFDINGKYMYVIGVQYDIAQSAATVEDMTLIDDLLMILPTIFK